MREGLAKSITPKPDGEAGYVVRSEPDRRTFKNAMVTIVFAGMYLEALMYIALQKRFGRPDALKIDRHPYEDRLKRLGITDHDLYARLGAFREARNDLVHEKALAIDDLGDEIVRVAQDTADSAMSLVRDLRPLLVHP